MLWTFGCAAYVFHPKETRANKQAPRSELMIFIGYTPGMNAYHFMCSPNNIIVTSSNAMLMIMILLRMITLNHLVLHLRMATTTFLYLQTEEIMIMTMIIHRFLLMRGITIMVQLQGEMTTKIMTINLHHNQGMEETGPLIGNQEL